MGIYQDILDYYQSNPPVDIDTEILPQYLITVEKVLNDTLIEYSKYRPIYEYKTINTGDKDKIDIYNDIHPLLLDIIAFGEKSTFNNEISHIFRNYSLNIDTSSSLLNLIADFEYREIIKEYFSVKINKQIIGGRYIIGLKKNTDYIFYYTRIRTAEELTIADKTDFEKLFTLNLMNSIYSNTKLMGETTLRSVSISGMSISFGFPSIEQQKKYIQEQKKNLIKTLTGEDGYLPEVF